MTLLEALFSDCPDLATSNSAESVGVAASVVSSRGPGHLCRLTSNPGGGFGLAEESLIRISKVKRAFIS